MRNAPVVVDLVSLHKCTFCGRAIESAEGSLLARHLCAHCGMPQPLSADENYFSAFGLKRKFKQDLSELEKRFYRFSRELHPDRFTLAGAEAQGLSLKRMSFLNQAYSTLRDASILREYLLTLEGVQTGKGNERPGLPMELAETWFEIQDLMTDDPAAAQEKITSFEQSLDAFQKEIDLRLERLESDYDREPSRQHLEEIFKEIQAGTYLNSLKSDLKKKKWK